MFFGKKVKIEAVEWPSSEANSNLMDRKLNEVIEANANLSDMSKRFNEIVDTFPLCQIDRRDEKSTFELIENRIGMLFVQVMIDEKVYKFLLDTGAQVTCLSYELAHKSSNVQVSDQKIPVGGADGMKDDMTMGYVNEFQALSLTMQNLPVLIMKADQLKVAVLGKELFRFDGILGWDILKMLDFKLDLKSGALEILNPDKIKDILSQPTNRATNFVTSEFPVITLIDGSGNARNFGIDTGATKSWIHNRLIKENDMTVTMERKKRFYGAHGVYKENILETKNLELRILDRKINIAKTHTGFTGLLNDYELDGVLGREILSVASVYCYNSKKIFLLR